MTGSVPKSPNPSKLEPMETSGSASPGRGVGPSVVGQLLRDRSLRLAALLAIGIGIPVAIMFYFQFRSLSDLGNASAVVLRQLSQETADAITKDLQDTLHAARTDVVLKIFQYQTEPLDLPFIETTFNQGLDAEQYVDGFYVWSENTILHKNDLLSFDRTSRRFVTNPPETELMLGQFRAMASAQRAIAVFDATLNGRISYRCMKADNGSGEYYHLAATSDEEAGKALQSRDFFKAYTEAIKRVSGGTVEVLPLAIIAETSARA